MRVGNITITQSEFAATGLTRGQQYWLRVGDIRSSKAGSWSDPATRMAGP